MLKGKLEYLGIDPKIIREYLVETLEVQKMMNADLTKNLDPIAFYRNELALVQVELLIAYLSLP